MEQSNPLHSMPQPPRFDSPLNFWRFAIAAVPMYALVMLITHHYGAEWLDAFTLANASTAIYFTLVNWYYGWYKRRGLRLAREWRKANGWLCS